MMVSRENWALVANYVERILRLNKRDLVAAEHVGKVMAITEFMLSFDQAVVDFIRYRRAVAFPCLCNFCRKGLPCIQD